jgi:fatty acid elongase 3
MLTPLGTGFVYFASWTYFTSTYWPWLPNAGKCAGEEFAAISGIVILSSYLLLFISFYLATYRKDGKRPSGRKAVRRMSQAPLPDPIHGSASTYANGTNGSAKASGVKTNGTATRSRRA